MEPRALSSPRASARLLTAAPHFLSGVRGLGQDVRGRVTGDEHLLKERVDDLYRLGLHSSIVALDHAGIHDALSRDKPSQPPVGERRRGTTTDAGGAEGMAERSGRSSGGSAPIPVLRSIGVAPPACSTPILPRGQRPVSGQDSHLQLIGTAALEQKGVSAGSKR
jgi:hypothetical protein